VSGSSCVDEIGLARAAHHLQKAGWMVGRSFDAGYDLLAYSPKHYRICSIGVVTFDLIGPPKPTELRAELPVKVTKTATHLIVYVEPPGWFFIARKEDILVNGGEIRAVLDQSGRPLDKNENPKSFGIFKDQWDQLLV
jgi:hypothetical protein